MLYIRIEGKRYPLPENYGDLTVRQFIELNQLFDDKDITTDTFQAKMIGITTGIPLELQSRISLKDYKSLLYNLQEGIQGDDFDNYMPKHRIKHKGHTYHLIDLDNMAFGTYLDLCNELDNGLDNLHNIVAILYRRKKGWLKRKEDDTNYLKLAEHFLDCPMREVIGGLAFFLLLSAVSRGTTQPYTSPEEQTAMKGQE